MKIGDLAQRTGMAASAIRFYESSGLLPPAKRGANGYRLYDEETLQRLLVIQIAQRLGFSLETLRRLAGHQGREMPHDLVMQSLQARLSEIDAMQKTLATQRRETETLMQQLQAQWQQGRCLELGAGRPLAAQAV
ncbi:MerR family transcriptional regulator [Paucibacter sp. B2R-40]|uniref:MerR family transcriptional regulator n=1 Tax=Paucibacter sp. B2R-40 TaxID=2893554 RepID=UPI0021E47F98|nr:MerR family transcriptional regulator [Paucibacter sp. B2R-40]MCV2356662.1 MerR family transcriptional regulator [Paucibacter sp. B2R-40]